MIIIKSSLCGAAAAQGLRGHLLHGRAGWYVMQVRAVTVLVFFVIYFTGVDENVMQVHIFWRGQCVNCEH